MGRTQAEADHEILGLMDDFSALRTRFFEGYAKHQPEDVTTLGRVIPRFRDATEAGLGDALAFHESSLGELARFPTDALDENERLDRFAMTSLARSLRRALAETRLPETTLEASGLPQGLVAHVARHAETEGAWAVAREVMADVPRAFREIEAAFARGRRRGASLSIDVVDCFTGYVLPGAATFFRELPRDAKDACPTLSEPLQRGLVEAAEAAAASAEAHAAFVTTELRPHASAAFALGRDEDAARARDFWDLTTPLDDLVGEAREAIAVAQRELVVLAGKVALARGEEPPRTHGEAGRLFLALWSQHPASAEEAMALYASAEKRARVVVAARALFNVPLRFAPSMRLLAPGFAQGTSATNMPAPLLDPQKTGHVLVARDAAMHSVMGAASLAVHEGFPGHYLQSAAWQRAFSGDAAPVRFLQVADDVAAASLYFGPMMNIEGYASYAEELMLEHGLFTDEEALLSVVAKAIRAARVVVDVGLHAGSRDPEEVAAWYAGATGMPLGWARGQVLRSKRIPLQVITYFLGKLGLDRLKAEAKRRAGAKFREAAFHDAWFRAGPVPASVAAASVLAAMTG